MEASRLVTLGPTYARRIQGALFNDAISGLFSALATSLPLTTFAQNNGVISLTNVASRQAGWWCAGFLFLLGILGKFGAWVTSIPSCVLGGMTTFLFANIISSGIKIITTQGNLDRRTRFIMGAALAGGIGVQLYPQFFTDLIGNDGKTGLGLWPSNSPDLSSQAIIGIREAIELILTTSFCLGAIIAFILNLIMPYDKIDPNQTKFEEELAQMKADALLGPVTDPSVAPKEAVAEGLESRPPTQPVMTV